MRINKSIGVSLVGALLQLGCAMDLQQRIDKRVQEDIEQISSLRHAAVNEKLENPSVRHAERPTPDLEKVYFSTPSWADEPIQVASSVALPLSYYMHDVVDAKNKLTQYDSGADPNVAVAIKYNGDIKGLIQALAAKLDYAYNIHDDGVTLMAFTTDTFEIAMFPGQISQKFGSQDQLQNANQTATGGAATMFSATTLGNTGEFANVSSDLNIWRDLSENIEALLGPEGTYKVSESTSTITVRDRPSRLSVIADFIHKLNKLMTRQVILDVQLVDITLNDANKLGVDWDLVRETVNTALSLNNQPGQIFFGDDDFGGSLAFSRFTGKMQGTRVLIRALREQGKVSVETTPRIVVLNNHPAEIRFNGSIFFIQRAGINTVADAGTTSEIEQGVIVTGFSLFMIPNITGGRVILHLSNNVTDLLGITTKSAGNIQVESPEFVEKVTNGSTVLNNGETLMLSGFRSYTNRSDDARTFGLIPSGRNLSSAYTESILLITARIVG